MHELAINLMEQLDEKYNMENLISLDEYLAEYYDLLTSNEIYKINTILIG